MKKVGYLGKRVVKMGIEFGKRRHFIELGMNISTSQLVFKMRFSHKDEWFIDGYHWVIFRVINGKKKTCLFERRVVEGRTQRSWMSIVLSLQVGWCTKFKFREAIPDRNNQCTKALWMLKERKWSMIQWFWIERQTNWDALDASMVSDIPGL